MTIGPATLLEAAAESLDSSRADEQYQNPTGQDALLVLGAGVTGLTVAWRLAQIHGARVVLLERASSVGGLAATHRRDGVSFDLGSHRLHDGYEPEVDALLQDLCGADLLRRERKGVIYLAGRALRYPPSTFDILFAFGFFRFLRFAGDLLLARLFRRRRAGEAESFATFTVRKVGRSLYRHFYRPYALKLYGMPTRRIAKDPAVSRVRKFSFATACRTLLRRSSRKPATYRYPSKGIGQLAETLRERYLQCGGRLIHVSGVNRLIEGDDHRISAVEFMMPDGRTHSLATDVVISTIPLDALYRLAPGQASCRSNPAIDLSWRSLRIIYLLCKEPIHGGHETYYFPEPNVIFGRVSELRQYSPSLNADSNKSVLTIEIPCSENDAKWNMADTELGQVCARELQELGILNSAKETEVLHSVKIKNVYPVYDIGWRARFDRIYRHLSAADNLYMIGRGALFLHCNIDHCMLMALKLARHLFDGSYKSSWEQTIQTFFNYRVRE